MNVVRYTHRFGGPDLIDPTVPLLPGRDGWVRPNTGCWLRMAVREHDGYLIVLALSVSPFDLPDHRARITMKVVKRDDELRTTLPLPEGLVPAGDPGTADPLEHRILELEAFGLDAIVMAASL